MVHHDFLHFIVGTVKRNRSMIAKPFPMRALLLEIVRTILRIKLQIKEREEGTSPPRITLGLFCKKVGEMILRDYRPLQM